MTIAEQDRPPERSTNDMPGIAPAFPSRRLTDHVTVGSPDEALDFIRHWTERTLVTENPDGPGHQPDHPASASTDETAPLQFEVTKSNDIYDRLNLPVTRPAWLFLADANYPGWNAYLDGKPAPVFSAQVLGKAVAVPAGQHELVLAFEPTSFRWGAGITLLSLVLTAAALWADRRRRHRLLLTRPVATALVTR